MQIDPLSNRGYTFPVENEKHIVTLRGQRTRIPPKGSSQNQPVGPSMGVQEEHFDHPLFRLGLVGHCHWSHYNGLNDISRVWGFDLEVCPWWRLGAEVMVGLAPRYR